MMLIGQLMKEHRIIEKVIEALREELARAHQDKRADTVMLGKAVDFIEFYADRTHHGKEEDILFAALKKKHLAEEHSGIIDELINEHAWAREKTLELSEALKVYESGDAYAINEVILGLEQITEFYPRHIEKEDKRFFYPSMEYLPEEEKERMMEEFRNFDMNLIHEKYSGIAEQLLREHRRVQWT